MKNCLLFLTLCFLVSPLYQQKALGETDNTESNKKFQLVEQYFPFSFSDSYYKKVFPKNHSKTYDLNKILEICLKKNWDIRHQYYEIPKAKAEILSRAGFLIPRIDFKIVAEPIPVDFSSMISGFFGFMIPSHWFSFFESLHLKRVQELTLVDLLLDKYLYTQLSYYEIHQLKWNITILSSFHDEFSNLLREIDEDPDIAKASMPFLYLKAYKEEIYEEILHLEHQLKQRLPGLAKDIGLEGAKNFIQFDISPMTFLNIEELEDLRVEEEISRLAIKNSITLMTFDFLKMANSHNMFATATQGILPNNEGLALDVGLDQLGKTLSISINNKSIQIQKQASMAKIENNVVLAVNAYNMALKQYRNAFQVLNTRREVLENLLRLYKNDHQLAPDLHHAIEFYINNINHINLSYHQLLMSNASLKRLLVLSLLKDIHQYNPEQKEIQGVLRKLKISS